MARSCPASRPTPNKSAQPACQPGDLPFSRKPDQKATLLETLPNGSRNDTSDLYGLGIGLHAASRSIKQEHDYDPITLLNRIVAALVCLIVGCFMFSLVFVF